MTPDAWLLLGLSGGAALWVVIVVEDLLWERGFDLFIHLFGGTK